MIYVVGTRVNDKDVDVLAAHNAANATKLDGKVEWKPTLVIKVDSIESVISSVENGAGPLNW